MAGSDASCRMSILIIQVVGHTSDRMDGQILMSQWKSCRFQKILEDSGIVLGCVGWVMSIDLSHFYIGRSINRSWNQINVVFIVLIGGKPRVSLLWTFPHNPPLMVL